MNTRTILTAVAVLAAAGGIRAGEAKQPSEAAAAFERIKGLSGEWAANLKTGKARLSYEVVAGGNAVLERDAMEGMPVMLTVYYLDGDRLLLTHYCMAGNEPRMQARRFDAATGELTFEFLDATNLASPAAGHMHDATLRLTDNNHLSSAWEFYENGKPKMTETAEYTRIH
jgi:hypothetical protein